MPCPTRNFCYIPYTYLILILIIFSILILELVRRSNQYERVLLQKTIINHNEYSEDDTYNKIKPIQLNKIQNGLLVNTIGGAQSSHDSALQATSFSTF